MSARKKRWTLKEQAPTEVVTALTDYPPLLANLLYQRGQQDPQSVAAFLSSEHKHGFHNPLLLKDMEIAARRIFQAIQSNEPIAVYGDFDVDGVTAVALLNQALGAMDADVCPYLPNRAREGYGLNHLAIEQLKADGVRLLLTVDCGISNLEEVAHARELGLDVIVTDHHTPPAELPPAYAIVNPRQIGDEYPFKGLVGVGIAYKLVSALVRLGMKMPLRGRDLLDLVALGTVADMGPLTGENRVLVQAGLAAMNETQRPGLQALIKAVGLVSGKISSEDIGFMLAPRLNAAGRLDDATVAYQLLLTQDPDEAAFLAESLNESNRQRQELTKQVQEQARQQIADLSKADDRIIILDDPSYPAGIVGLVAARLVEDYARPVLLLERGSDISRGSARSVPGFNILDALLSCRDLFVRYGGHSAAAGFTIATERLPELKNRLQEYAAAQLSEELLTAVLEIDAEVPLSDLTEELEAQIAQLGPFGAANPRPVLMSSRVRVTGAWAKGKDGQHLKLRLDDGNGGPSYDAIAFHLGQYQSYFSRPLWVDIAYTLEMNTWNGSRTLQLNVKDFRSRSSKDSRQS